MYGYYYETKQQSPQCNLLCHYDRNKKMPSTLPQCSVLFDYEGIVLSSKKVR
jgi:hypothetical protein